MALLERLLELLVLTEELVEVAEVQVLEPQDLEVLEGWVLVKQVLGRLGVLVAMEVLEEVLVALVVALPVDWEGEEVVAVLEVAMVGAHRLGLEVPPLEIAVAVAVVALDQAVALEEPVEVELEGLY